MAVPAGPFAGLLLTEIAKARGGLPAVAIEMGVKPQAIDEIASGAVPSAADLDRIYQWLAQRVPLAPNEIADYNRLRVAALREGEIAVPGPRSRDDDDSTARATRPVPAFPMTAGTVMIATIGVAVVILLTVLITITITKPQGAQAAGSLASPKPEESSATPLTDKSHAPASPVANRSSAATATLAPSSTTLPMPSTPTAGKLVNSYDNFELSADYGFDFAAGSPPQPQEDAENAFGPGDAFQDLWYGDNGEFGSDTGQLSIPVGSQAATFTNCKDATAYTNGNLTAVQPGTTICYTGSNIVAAATVVNFESSSNGVDYALLDVKIWQNPS
jgi:hypothetical protein